jgi:single-stranded-DNA-specific exonuclease
VPEAAVLVSSPSATDASGLRAVSPDEGRRAAPRLPRRLEIPAYDLQAALALEQQLGLSHALAQVLVRRGLSDADRARAFLHPAEAHEPSAFSGIEAAVALIERHIGQRGRIVVHGDYDVDGVCATAVTVRALRALGADVGWFIPDRQQDGYGISEATISRLAERGTDLLITVDCGITAVEEVAAARAAGIDVVLTDHHAPRPDGLLPVCAIVHPSTCGYPCRDLCGTAVAYKLAQALRATTAEEDIELVALATVADLMPLQGENRRLVREGLEAMANTARPGLRALMTVSRVDPSSLDAGVLGFRLAPRINAAGRLRRADAGLELLLTDDAQRAQEIATELDAVNAERRAVEQRIVWEAEGLVAEIGERPAYLLAAEGWHPGVIGIVASRIVERYHRPTLLVAIDEEGLGHGSGRSIPGFDLLAALHAAAEHMERYGGHRAAAGFSVRRDRIELLRSALEEHSARVLTPELLEPLERVDAIVSGAELGLGLAEELEQLEPCGIGNPQARLLVPGARFGEPRPMGEGRHLRFSVASGGALARAVAFGCDGQLGVDPGQPADAAFRLERNVWNGAVEPRLVLRHAATCAPAPIEVIGEPADYVAAVLEELARTPDAGPPAIDQGRTVLDAGRTVLDRRGESPLTVLADACAGGGTVVAVCADVPRRIGGLRARTGGFCLVCHHAVELAPTLLDEFAHVVVLDPATSGDAERLLRTGSGFTHLAWGAAELRFVQQMHELEYGLRTSLTAVYRGLRQRRTAAGEELERLLRGEGPHGRPARLAARLIRVLAELELVSLDRDLPALTIADETRTALDRSPSYRAYMARYEDGRTYLRGAKSLPNT